MEAIYDYWWIEILLFLDGGKGLFEEHFNFLYFFNLFEWLQGLTTDYKTNLRFSLSSGRWSYRHSDGVDRKIDKHHLSRVVVFSGWLMPVFWRAAEFYSIHKPTYKFFPWRLCFWVGYFYILSLCCHISALLLFHASFLLSRHILHIDEIPRHNTLFKIIMQVTLSPEQFMNPVLLLYIFLDFLRRRPPICQS